MTANRGRPIQESEVLASRTHSAAAKTNPDPADWLTPEQATFCMIEMAIEAAALWAERAFLAACRALPLAPVTQQWADAVATSIVGEMQGDTARIADELDLPPAQSQHFEQGRAAVFASRLAELQAMVSEHRGSA